LAGNAASTYTGAMNELAEIRQRLAGGRLSPDDIEALASQAGRAVDTARAALRRSGESIEWLGTVVDDGPPP
jgi:broad specificity phosphatase PhoE